MRAFYNTKDKGTMQFLIYKDGNDYAGVCLNFGLEEYGNDPIKLQESIFEAACSYLEAVQKKGLPDEYLNIPPEKKHLDQLKEIVWKEELEKRVKNYINVNIQKQPTFFSFTKQPYREGIVCSL